MTDGKINERNKFKKSKGWKQESKYEKMERRKLRTVIIFNVDRPCFRIVRNKAADRAKESLQQPNQGSSPQPMSAPSSTPNSYVPGPPPQLIAGSQTNPAQTYTISGILGIPNAQLPGAMTPTQADATAMKRKREEG